MSYLRRKLWFTDRDGHHQLDQNDLLMRSEPIVVLGEPGMGKTELLRAIGDLEGHAYCRAPQLINRTRPETLLESKRCLIIDALDEVSAQSEGTAVDLVLRKLGELDYPPFILSCRVGDWRAAISTQAIADQYDGVSPLEVHLEPLDDNEQYELLTQLIQDGKRARTLLDHFERFGLDFLGNPQTLKLIASLSPEQPLPETNGALFEQAIESLRQEQNARKQELPRGVVLDAAGAAFAALILSGNTRIVDQPSGTIDFAEKALPLAEVELLANGNLKRAADTRLFATDQDGLTYVHRRVGEFVGARWLAARANTRRKRQRLLNQFRSHGLVPASLRGLHSWLALDPQLADAVIDADPMGVIEYGDADALNPDQARHLLLTLEKLFVNNPRLIGWQEYHAAALVAPPLMNDVARIVGDQGAEFRLRLLLLQQLKNMPTAEGQRTLLRERIFDESELYAIRHESAQVLIKLGGENWPELLEELRLQVQEDSLRLAYELLDDIGIDVLSDEQIVAIVLAHDGLSVCPLDAGHEHSSVLGLEILARHIPIGRLDNLLDLFADQANALLPQYAGIEEKDLIDLQYALVCKRIKDGDQVEPLRLWRWLEPFAEQVPHQSENSRKIGEWLKANPLVRQAIQHHVLIEKVDNKKIWQRAYCLHRGAIDLYPVQTDIISLLQILDPSDRNDERWREIIKLGHTWGEEGKVLREAAKSFAQHRPDLLVWIDNLAKRQVPEWELKQKKKKQQREAKLTAKFADDRRNFLASIESVKAGKFNWIHAPAQVYLKRFIDIGDGVPAHKRIGEWLGEEIALAVYEGFEKFLQVQPPRPSARAIVRSYAKSKRWPAGDIIVAALGERVRTLSKPFKGISSERLAAGLFVCWYERIDNHAGLEELAFEIEEELKRRDRWKQVVRIYIQPQLKQQGQHIDHLGKFMRDGDENFSAHLAEYWLIRYPRMSNEAEVEMIDCLLRFNRFKALQKICASRKNQEISGERQRNWQAIALIVNFDEARLQLNSVIEPELLWHLRDRTGDNKYRDRVAVSLSIKQLEWIITTFRSQWPEVSRPRGTTVGDSNPWDASEYIRSLITRLANDVSTEALTALSALKDAPEDNYTWTLRMVSAEQHQKQADESYTPPTIDQIRMVLDSGPPCSVADLRAIVADEFRELGKRLRGSSEDEINLYWTDDGCPRTENECRDITVALLRGHLAPLSIYSADEADMPQNKRADIVYQYNALLLPVEAKRQQHKDLWIAIDDQLEAFYTGHWQAQGQGLFLVFWFGAKYPVPKHLDEVTKPSTANDLQKMLNQYPAVTAGRVEAVVLDLSR